MPDVTAPFGFPYPEDTDLVRDGAADIEALAEGVNDQLALGFVFVGTRFYTSSGTFVKADPFGDSSFDGAKLRAIRVRVQGAGGGGGGAATTGAGNTAIASAGGGGAYSESFITDIAGLDASVTVTRGSGGAGGAAGNNNGSAGGNSSFGTSVVANGGTTGSGSAAVTPALTTGFTTAGAGNATTGTGDFVVAGPPSFAPSSFPSFGNVFPPVVPATFLGSAQISPNTTTGYNGGAGLVHGGGGVGGANAASQATARAGGAGANGIVIVDVFA